MPSNPSLVIEQSDGTTRDTLTAIYADKQKSLIEQWVGIVRVDRAEWLNIKPNVDERTDHFIIEKSDGTTFWAGRYSEDNRDGDTVTIQIESYERDAIDAEPTGAKLVENNVADSFIATTYGIDQVGTLSQGTIETGASSISFSFSHAERSKIIRDAAEPAQMDVAYNPDQTVDFVNRLGSDKSGSITLSTTSQDFIESLGVEDMSRDPVTHVRGLGAQQGNGQVTTESVVSSYSAGERQVWRLYVNKDIQNQNRLQELTDSLAAEYDSAPLRLVVNASIVDQDINLGDSVKVSLPEDNIDQKLRLTSLTNTLSNNPRIEGTFTNRGINRGGRRKDRDDIKRFNSGDQGFIDRDNFRAIERQPVDSTYNAQGNYFYPSDVIREDRAEVVVQSLPYRSYVSAAGHDHSVSISDTSTDNSEFSTVADQGVSFQSISVSDTDSWVDADTWTPSGNTSMAFAVVGVRNTGTSAADTFVQFNNKTQNFEWGEFSVSTLQPDGVRNFAAIDPRNVDGDTLAIQVTTNDTSTTYDVGVSWLTVGRHTHSVSDTSTTTSVAGFDPGLNEYTNETASGVDLIINGSTVASNIGSGEFTTTVDVSGEFSQGNNWIELTSDSLGFISATVITELFRSGET